MLTNIKKFFILAKLSSKDKDSERVREAMTALENKQVEMRAQQQKELTDNEARQAEKYQRLLSNDQPLENADACTRPLLVLLLGAAHIIYSFPSSCRGAQNLQRKDYKDSPRKQRKNQRAEVRTASDYGTQNIILASGSMCFPFHVDSELIAKLEDEIATGKPGGTAHTALGGLFH